jgi:hypothetical protein
MQTRSIRYRPTVEALGGARSSDLMQVSLSIVLAILVMLLLGSNSLLSWCNNLPVGQLSDLLVGVSQAWQDALAQIGFTWFAETIRAVLRSFEAMRWG